MQKKKGITLSMLATIIVITIILTSTIILSVNDIYSNSRLRTFVTEYTMINDEVKLRQKTSTDMSYMEDAIEMNLADVNQNILDTQFVGENIQNNKITVYKIDIAQLGFNNANYGKEENNLDVYAISMTTGRIYYLNGIKGNSTTYYTLTEDLQVLAGSKYNIDEVNKQVIFKPSEFSWTANAIKTEVILPKEFTDISVTTDLEGENLDNVSGIVEEDDKYIVTVNINEIKTNYNITVTYINDGERVTETFEIKNYDGTAPSLTVGSQTYKVSDYDLKAYIQDILAVDDTSGIAKIKYENDKISVSNAKDYFSSKGEMLKGSTILIDNKSRYYTVYAEDKAGNATIYNVTVSDEIINARVINGFNISKGVGEPLILDGMTPVVYDSSSTTGDYWRNATQEEIKYSTWYSYDIKDKKWANARTPDGSLWVWIPRFEYDILEEPGTVAKEEYGTINIRFIPKTITKTTDRYTINSKGVIISEDGYTIHPAFVNEIDNQYYNGGWDKELTGIWVAKFEMSMLTNGVNTATTTNALGNKSTSDSITAVSKAGLAQWRFLNAANAYFNGLDYTTRTSGLSTNYASHLIKNSEWGAMTYLAHSKYGAGIQNIIRNSDTTYHTGGSSNISEIYSTNRNQSTTGNAYGIYDTCGGVMERVAVFNTDYKPSSTNFYTSTAYVTSDGKHFASVGGQSTRYATAYNAGASAAITELNSRTGDATYEIYTSTANFSWGAASSTSVIATTALLNRGGMAGQAISKISQQTPVPGATLTGGFRVVLAEN